MSSKINGMADAHRGGSPAGKWHAEHAPQRLDGVTGIADLEAKKGPAEVFSFGTCLPASKVDPTELRDFLQRRRNARNDAWNGTQYAKLVCYLDWLENGDVSQAG